MAPKLVCVTGATGFVASWIVKVLLEKGYNVRGTVRSLGKAQHLRDLPGANESLELVEADLLIEGSFDSAFEGCDGVFHAASPVILNTKNPEAELVEPAVKGTLNVLESCFKKNVRKVIVTSSMASVFVREDLPEVLDENTYSDPEYCRKTELSKTLAEQEAWKFAKEKGLNMITIHPGLVAGPMLQPTLNASNEFLLHFMDGSRTTCPNIPVRIVGTRDTAMAHILAYENPAACGRYICVERIVHARDFTMMLRKMYPELPVATNCDEDTTVHKFSNEKLQHLGVKFQPIEEMMRECVDSFKEHKLINC